MYVQSFVIDVDVTNFYLTLNVALIVNVKVRKSQLIGPTPEHGLSYFFLRISKYIYPPQPFFFGWWVWSRLSTQQCKESLCTRSSKNKKLLDPYYLSAAAQACPGTGTIRELVNPFTTEPLAIFLLFETDNLGIIH